MANVEELIELTYFLSAQEGIPANIQSEFKNALEQL